MNGSSRAFIPLAQSNMRNSCFRVASARLFGDFRRFHLVRTIVKLVQSQEMLAGTAF
jgi:hypothetical protein